MFWGLVIVCCILLCCWVLASYENRHLEKSKADLAIVCRQQRDELLTKSARNKRMTEIAKLRMNALEDKHVEITRLRGELRMTQDDNATLMSELCSLVLVRQENEKLKKANKEIAEHLSKLASRAGVTVERLVSPEYASAANMARSAWVLTLKFEVDDCFLANSPDTYRAQIAESLTDVMKGRLMATAFAIPEVPTSSNPVPEPLPAL